MIDTHVHVWDLEHLEYLWLEGNQTILNRSYTLEQFIPQARSAGIMSGVLVQAANTLDETNYMLDLAATHPFIMGVVGWMPLQRPEEVQSIIDGPFTQNPYWKGVRHLIHDEPDPAWLLQGPVVESLGLLAEHDIPFDFVGTKLEHLDTAIRLKSLVPELRLMIDHMNQPPVIRVEEQDAWKEKMRVLSGWDRCHIKISGLGTACQVPNWTPGVVEPWVEFIYKSFGADRMCWGGDWPVSLLAGSYGYTIEQYRELFRELVNFKDEEKITHTNAIRFYDLPDH